MANPRSMRGIDPREERRSVDSRPLDLSPLTNSLRAPTAWRVPVLECVASAIEDKKSSMALCVPPALLVSHCHTLHSTLRRPCVCMHVRPRPQTILFSLVMESLPLSPAELSHGNGSVTWVSVLCLRPRPYTCPEVSTGRSSHGIDSCSIRKNLPRGQPGVDRESH